MKKEIDMITFDSPGATPEFIRLHELSGLSAKEFGFAYCRDHRDVLPQLLASHASGQASDDDVRELFATLPDRPKCKFDDDEE